MKVCLVADAGPSFRPDALIDFLIPRVPRFMIPRYVEVMDALPRTPTEKVRKEVLRQAGVTPETGDREAAGLVLPR